MLRIQKLTPAAGLGGAAYYLDLASRDISAYYAGSGEAPGVWLGNGIDAVTAGIGGQIISGNLLDADGATLFQLLNSREVVERLFPPQRRQSNTLGKKWVSGYDFTFSAPKGLSMLATMTDDVALRRAIYDAHEAAVTAAMAAVEAVACWGREGKGGVDLVRGRGLIAAAFRHRTGRPAETEDIPDPHLHTHVVVANVVQHPDGTFGALDGRAFTERGNTLALAVGSLYRAQLGQELTDRGIYLRWQPAGRNGVMEVAGLDPALIEAFSTRHAEIEAELARAGLTGTKATDMAQKNTRRAKDKEVASASDLDLGTLLRGKLADVGGSLDDLHSCLHDKANQRDLTPAELDELALTLVAAPAELVKQDIETPAEHLTTNSATFTYWDAVGALSRSAHGRAGANDIQKAVGRLLNSQTVLEVERESAQTEEPSLLPWRRRFTTPEIMAMEQSVVALTQTALPKAFLAISETDLNLDGLSADQVAMCLFLANDKQTIAAVVGVAGSGKTYALTRMNAAWQTRGIVVIGCAKSARAAWELETGSGIPSGTIDRLLGDIRSSGAEGYAGLPDHCVVVVDEASMAETRQLAELAGAVHNAGGKLILAGDDHQLGSVAAGGLFAHLVNQTKHVTLTENVRNRAEANVLAQLRLGMHTDEIVEGWSEDGRLHVADNRLYTLGNIVTAWEFDTADGKDSRMLASTRADVELLNGIARARRVERGEIEPGTVVGDREYSIGDKVIALKNRKKFGVRNGNRGVIQAVENASVVVQFADERITLPISYAEKYLDYAYCTTIYKAQGMTCDTAHVLASSGLARETGYVGASRARETTHFYCETELPVDIEGISHGHELNDTRTAQERLAGQLAVAHNEQAASTYDSPISSISGLLLSLDEICQAQRDHRSQDPVRQADGRDKLAKHRYALGLLATIDPPPDVANKLGRPPVLPDERMAWRAAAADMMMPTTKPTAKSGENIAQTHRQEVMVNGPSR